MSLTLDEDLGVISISVPAETNCLCAFSFLETAQVEAKIFVVKVNGGNSRVLWLELLVGIKYCDVNDSVSPASWGGR